MELEMTNEQIVAKIKAGEKHYEELLVSRNINLVRRLAHKYNIPGVEVKDRIQDGCIGMLEAINTYDPSRGVLFSSHAFKRIRARILRDGTEQANMIHLPAHIVELKMKLNNIVKDYIATTGKRPTIDYLQQVTGKPLDDIKAAIEDQTMPGSLDQTIDGGEGDQMAISDVIGGDLLENEHWEDSRTKAIVDYLDELPKLEQTIVIERLGLRDGVAKTVRELEGVILDENGGKISYVTISTRYDKAITYIKNRIAGSQEVFGRTTQRKAKKVKDANKRDIVVAISQATGKAYMAATLDLSQETQAKVVSMLHNVPNAHAVMSADDVVVLQYEKGVTMDQLEAKLKETMNSITDLGLEILV